MADPIVCRSGIYRITHVTSGLVYIGSAVNLERRWSVHKCNLGKGKHHSKRMQRIWDKYGDGVFIHSALEYVADINTLLTREQHWIDTYRASSKENGFNTNPKAESRLGAKQGYAGSVAQIEAMRRTHKGKIVSTETRAKLSAANKARTSVPVRREWTQEQKIAASLQFKNRTFSDETRARMSAAKKGKPRSLQSITNSATAHRGLKRSPEALANLKAGAAKRTFTDEQRAAIAVKTRLQHQKRRALNAAHRDD